jgi:hypothetical protein
MAMSVQPAIDEARLNAFVGRMLGDLGAVTNAVLVHIGDQLGFYKAMAKSGPIDSAGASQTNRHLGTPGARMVVGAGSPWLSRLRQDGPKILAVS